MSAFANSPSTDHYDVIVIGGGPAGSTAAALVACEGRRVLVLDREQFPRFRIGESLMPATYWTFKRLGVLDQMNASSFPRKQSVQFFSKSGRSSSPFYFAEFNPDESSITWQVDREAFDLMLLRNAAERGAEVCSNANVRDIMFEGDRAVGVRVQFGDKGVRELTCRVVVDASGQTGLIARKLGLRIIDEHLRHASYFTRYRGAMRGEGVDEGATLIMQTATPRVWFWSIPLPDDIVSVGVVGPIEKLVQGRKGGPQAVFDEELAGCPAIQERIAGAERVQKVGVLRDFSYIAKSIAGDGWILAGDAFGFLDPVYSSGVFLALKSGEMAADSVLAAFNEDDCSARSLGRHGDEFIEGMESLRKLAYAFYDETFSVPRFLKHHPECREHIVNLLIGNVYRTSIGNLFELMSSECKLPESRRLVLPERTR